MYISFIHSTSLGSIFDTGVSSFFGLSSLLEAKFNIDFPKRFREISSRLMSMSFSIGQKIRTMRITQLRIDRSSVRILQYHNTIVPLSWVWYQETFTAITIGQKCRKISSMFMSYPLSGVQYQVSSPFITIIGKKYRLIRINQQRKLRYFIRKISSRFMT